MDPCPKCGDPEGEAACAEKRASFRTEPQLPGGFEIGAQWTSYDGGLTWCRFPAPPPPCNGMRGHMTVADVDTLTGSVTVTTAFKVPD